MPWGWAGHSAVQGWAGHSAVQHRENGSKMRRIEVERKTTFEIGIADGLGGREVARQ